MVNSLIHIDLDALDELAATELQERRAGNHQPKAIYDANAGYWILDSAELLVCCHNVVPSFHMQHARSIEHVATLFGTTRSRIRRALDRLPSRLQLD